ncbi:hypothetical protein [Lentzea flaviverrucosa]|uniref:Uncharacterized protein n=1 Tax=Lentzea flaviverrucosa TaxID=200379 RepID=A0A1H9SH18_9PSEU|nr:hypothetical protein [Lentzea flaviverrucosa]RDI25369.1 hypothetical protein DFR72_10861 [Lentzea flaviverrucosa]SER84277.1 hypothetical protein SAMN05216195_10762 [Lentzea flaviverrucosa]
MHSPELLLTKRFGGDRPGLLLLGIEKAAVPVTVVAAEVLAQEIKQLPLLDEFVLRLLKTGVGAVPDIAAFLGLERELVEVAVADQYREGAVAFGAAPGDLLLTARGEQLAREHESVRPVQKTFKVVFDRLTWSVATYEERALISKSSAVADGRILLPGQRTTRVKREDISPAAVNSILRQPGRSASIDVLDVIDVTPSTYKYMPVDVLVYGDEESGDVETAVVVDGDHSEKHDSVLGRLGGVAKLGFRIEPAGPHPALPPGVEVQRVQGAPLEESSPPVCGIGVWEHQLVLTAALQSATERLLIATDLAVCSVVDAHFLSRLEQRLRARVQVDLVVARCDEVTEAALGRLAQRSRYRLNLHRPEGEVRNTLVYDGNWVVSDFPWLSYRGAARPFRAYEGTVVAVQEEADREYAALLPPVES